MGAVLGSPQVVYQMKITQILTRSMKRHEPSTRGQQVVPSAPKLPAWGSETPGLMKAQFQYTHTKGVKSPD